MRMAQKKFMAICIIFVVAVTCLGAKGAVAQDAAEGKVLRVSVKPIAPFVFKHETELSGFSIDLWNALAQSLKVETTWVEVTSVGDQLQAVKSGKADAAIAAITITRERENIVDFTQPYFDSGLQIMVHAQGGNHLLDVFDSIPWPTLGVLLGAFIAIMFVMANVLWIVERQTSEHFRKSYLKGIGEGLWGVALIVATGEHGDRQHAKVVKRFIVFFMWLVGVVLIAQLTATISSTQTVDRLSSKIRGTERSITSGSRGRSNTSAFGCCSGSPDSQRTSQVVRLAANCTAASRRTHGAISRLMRTGGGRTLNRQPAVDPAQRSCCELGWRLIRSDDKTHRYRRKICFKITIFCTQRPVNFFGTRLWSRSLSSCY